MTTHFAKVWKATAYCRTEGVLAASDGERSLWLPIERPIAADVRVQTGVSSTDWTATDSRQDWVDDAHLLAEHLGFPTDIRANISFRVYPTRDMGMRAPRAAALAAVKAVASAAELPLNPVSLYQAEKALGDPTGLAFGAAGISGAEGFVALGSERYTWLYARPVFDVAATGPCGPESILNSDASLIERLGKDGLGSGVREVMLETAIAAGVDFLAIAGGVGEAHPAALLLRRDQNHLSTCQRLAAKVRVVLGSDWAVGASQSAVCEADWLADA